MGMREEFMNMPNVDALLAKLNKYSEDLVKGFEDYKEQKEQQDLLAGF